MQGETALISGASSGIGEALAGEFAAHGHELVLVARSEDKLRSLAAKLRKQHGVQVRSIPADLSRPGASQALLAACGEARLSIDILVNNAGVLEHGAFADMAPVAQQRMIALNVVGLTDMLAHFLPPMCERGHGRIVNLASIAAFQPVAALATYAASKAFVLSLSESLAEELRGSGVTVTAVCPGVTATNMLSGAVAGNSKLDTLPSLLIGEVGEVAGQTYRACMSGEVLVVPGKLNQAMTLVSRATPKWLVRRLSGALGRAAL